jgi:hypothetical protein
MALNNPGREIPLNQLEPGVYYWTIQAEASDGFDISAPAPAAFRVLPVMIHRVQLEQEATEIPGLTAIRQPGTVRWSTTETVGTSRFILSRNPNPLTGEPVMDIRNPDKTINLISLREGTYYWTIRAEAADGIDISAQTPMRFRVLPTPLLPAAAQQRPESGYVIGPAQLRASREIAFTWAQVSGANAYIFSLLNSSGEIIRTETLRQTSYTIQDISILDVGNFIWQVEAVDRENNGVVIQHGTVIKNNLTIDIPLPGDPRLHNTGNLYEF